MQDTNKINGLAQSNINLIVTIFTICLLLWGPVEPFGMFVRTAYLVLFPILLYFGLGHFGKKWDIDKAANERLNRAIAGVIAGLFFAQAGLYFTAKQHTECDQRVPTRDGTECVGDFITVDGADKAGGFIALVFGGLATWYAVAEHKKKGEN